MKVKKVLLKAHALPEVLRNIPDPPTEVHFLGNFTPLLEKPRLAVVGSRKVTPYGRAVVSDLIQAVAKEGVVTISGLALGVDACVHQHTLAAGGQTIAVLPCGLDKPYPATHRQLARQIIEQGGALVSEYSDGTPPHKHHFIARNRLVSGLSDALLIIEAAEKSGTLHTANFALEQGRTVMAVPGNITSEQSGGTNNLIKSGAIPVTSADDILLALGIERSGEQRELFAANAEEAAIIALIKRGISDTGELQLLSELDAIVFGQTLTMLEISGKIRPLGAGHWSLV